MDKAQQTAAGSGQTSRPNMQQTVVTSETIRLDFGIGQNMPGASASKETFLSGQTAPSNSSGSGQVGLTVSSSGYPKKKSSSFQITSITTTRNSNEGAEDSADDAEDISDINDSSRMTDTPSLSEDFSRSDDIFYGPAPPVVPTGAQYGITALVQQSGTGGVMTARLPQGVTVNVTEGGIALAKADVDSDDVEQWQKRFKIVKIDSNEPIRRGRWVCLDFMDSPTVATAVARKEETTVVHGNTPVSESTANPQSHPPNYSTSHSFQQQVQSQTSQQFIPSAGQGNVSLMQQVTYAVMPTNQPTNVIYNTPGQSAPCGQIQTTTSMMASYPSQAVNMASMPSQGGQQGMQPVPAQVHSGAQLVHTSDNSMASFQSVPQVPQTITQQVTTTAAYLKLHPVAGVPISSGSAQGGMVQQPVPKQSSNMSQQPVTAQHMSVTSQPTTASVPSVTIIQQSSLSHPQSQLINLVPLSMNQQCVQQKIPVIGQQQMTGQVGGGQPVQSSPILGPNSSGSVIGTVSQVSGNVAVSPMNTIGGMPIQTQQVMMSNQSSSIEQHQQGTQGQQYQNTSQQQVPVSQPAHQLISPYQAPVNQQQQAQQFLSQQQSLQLNQAQQQHFLQQQPMPTTQMQQPKQGVIPGQQVPSGQYALPVQPMHQSVAPVGPAEAAIAPSIGSQQQEEGAHATQAVSTPPSASHTDENESLEDLAKALTAGMLPSVGVILDGQNWVPQPSLSRRSSEPTVDAHMTSPLEKQMRCSFVSASTASSVAIDNKIEQAMDLVKSHLMFAVREEVEVLKEKISELMERITQLESENTTLRQYAPQEALPQQTQPHHHNPGT